MVPGLATALEARTGTLVYVANLQAEPGETDGYGLDEHVAAVERHGIAPDVVIVDNDNSASTSDRYRDRIRAYELVGALQSTHDPRRLGAALSTLFS